MPRFVTVATSPISLYPSQVVEAQLFDTRGQAVCADCGSVWQSAVRAQTVVLMGHDGHVA